MKLLVAYASTEGQTRKIARRVTDRLADTGHTVELLPLADAQDVDLARFDRVILAASVHLGHYQKDLATFARAHVAELVRTKALFLSVSLAAAGHEAEDWRGLDRILDDLCSATGWTPHRVEQIAGAYRPSDYDVFRRFVMRRVVAKRDPASDPEADREYTDWAALDAVVDDWLAG